MALGTLRVNSKDNSRRRYHGSGPRPDLNETKASEAKERQEAWCALTPSQQLVALDVRLGTGVGASKQRARLAALLGNARSRSQSDVQKESDRVVEPGPEKLKAKDRRALERGERSSK